MESGTEDLVKQPSGRRMSDRGEIRREAMLRGARYLFFKSGYGAVSTNDITNRVGGSKRDLYKWFGGKRGIFDSVVRQECGRVVKRLEAVTFDGLSRAEALENLGLAYLSGILSDNILSLHRIMVAESRHFGELYEEWMRSGPSKAVEVASGTFEGAQFHDASVACEPHELAQLYLDMLTTDLQLRCLRGPVPDLEQLMKKKVEGAVSIMINGLRWP